MKEIDSGSVRLLLKLVYEGNLVGADHLLKQNSTLALAQCDIIDLSQREFKKIKAFQYAAWCLDSEMCLMMLENNHISKKDAALQLDVLYNHRPDITNIYGKHFNFDPLLKAYGKFVNDKKPEDWIEVRKEQHKVPAWYVYVFCEQGSNAAWLKIDLDNIKIKREIFNNYVAKWFTSTSGWVRGHNEYAYVYSFLFLEGFRWDRRVSENFKLKQMQLLTELEIELKKELEFSKNESEQNPRYF